MKTLVFFGDSITQFAAQKNGYIDRLRALLKENSLEESFRIIGSGIGGNTITNLIDRYKRDVVSHHPDLICIYIGINDVWHYPPVKDKEREESFRNNYQDLLSSIQDNTSAQIILCTLSVIGERRSGNPYDNIIEAYSSVIKSLALTNQCKVCDLRKIFLEYIHEYNTTDQVSGLLTTDGVHLSDDGNKLIAEAIYPLLLA